MEKASRMSRFTRTVLLCITFFLLFQLISLYLSWPKQIVLGAASILLGLIANRLSASRVVTLALMLISMTATLRYGWWRVNLLIDFFSDQSNHRIGLDSAFMLILISAEAYTVLIMVLGYMQTAWPLKRKPILLPNDDTQWPHVDVLIPTYNEPLSLVRYTALAANNIDYPPEKLHVYILDDGSREEFKSFSLEAGIGYVTRAEHNHAKAGNINHALTRLDSPFVTIFDCDHIPTRSFLQMTLGWMLVDPDLAMLQTPHHFYSPDPFERNLLQYKTIPSEAELFYGIIQDGNDFWNATFFCGSCALIRRSALDEVGGIAVETVTEDAHTSLRMQKLGYNTAYINIPQAAGLATETLAAHVGQRIRWARGMIQIFRTDNPLLARGMKFSQRLCYLNAMIHFLYAVPRLVFLTSPLVYMLLGRTIIPGYWVAIVAYSFPHLVLSSLTNSRIQGRHRHSFWNEIYEAVLAPYILAPTLLALINPKLGKFNVTDKGSTLSETKFDSKIATPTKWLLLLNLLGLLMVPYRIFIKDPQHPGTVVMNLVWILFNIVILGVAAAVAHEQKQRRSSVRIEARIPVRIHLAGGRSVDAVSVDMSVGGASIALKLSEPLVVGSELRVSFPDHAGEADIGARVVGANNNEVRLAFSVPTIAEQETLTRAVYSRADAWLNSADAIEVDRPLKSLGRVIRLSFSGIYQIIRSHFPEKRAVPRPRPAQTAAIIVLMSVLGCCYRVSGSSLHQEDARTADAETRRHPPIAQSAMANEARLPDSASTDLTTNAQQIVSLKEMGLSNLIEMRGLHSYYTLHFTISNALVPRHASIKLRYSIAPDLDPHSTTLKVSINGTSVATLQPTAGSDGGFIEATIPVPEDQLVRNNGLTFEFTGSGIMQREDQASSRILARIGADSSLEVIGDPLRLRNDLSQLPLPVFDVDLQSTTVVPFTFLTPPTPTMLEAAGAVASWLGVLASSRPVRFAVTVGVIPRGNVVLFAANRSAIPSSLQIPAGSDTLLTLKENPSDPYGSVLVLAGDSDDQLLTVARSLALSHKATSRSPAQGLALEGDTAQIPDLILPPARKKEDAPRWLPLDRVADFIACRGSDALQSDGSSPIPVYFHVPPDLYYGEKQNLKLDLNYRYNAAAVAAGSALRVVINGTLVSEALLPPGPDFVDNQRIITVPVAAMRPFGNTALFNFNFVPANRDAGANPASGALRGEIQCNSSLDLHGLALWTRLPNLELFANAGFPFTRMADLSETTVVLPAEPSTDEIALYLHLMAHFGSQTGYPALRVTVSGPSVVLRQDRDYLVLGTVTSQPAFRSLDSLLPATFDANGVHTKPARSYLTFVRAIEVAWSHWQSKIMGQPTAEKLPTNEAGIPDALIEEVESPSSPDRCIVLVALKDDAGANSLADVFLDRSQSRDIAGSVSLFRHQKFESYQVEGQTFHVGDITWFAMMRIWLTQHFLLLLAVVSTLSFMVAYWTREWLSQRACERLKLSGSVYDTRLTVDRSES